MNRMLDTLVRPTVRVFGKSRSSFQVCAFISLALYILLTMTLDTYLGLSPWAVAAIVPAAIVVLMGRLMLTDTLPVYHLQITVIVVAAALAGLLHRPVLPVLDVTALGLGTVVTVGRIGCFMVGCCHGRPYHLGVCYREEHAAAGFTSYLVGVRLFPAQAAESLWALLVVGVGVGMVLSGQAPGTALAWYAVMYALGRFSLEFLRAEPHRPFFRGFSEAQWTSVLVAAAVAGAGWGGAIPFHPWQVAAAAGLASALIAVALSRRLRTSEKHRLLHPRHIKELAEAVALVSDADEEKATVSDLGVRSSVIEIGCTSLGIQLSAGRLEEGGRCVDHYTLSACDRVLQAEDASALAKLILLLKRHRGSSEFITGGQGVFHLLIYPPAAGNYTETLGR